MRGATVAAPKAPVRRTGALHLLLRARSSWIGSFGADAYEEKVIERRILWRRNLVISDPAGVRHVLLDNAANYSKTAIARRLLEPGLGKGLITMEGETWRKHRRIMAPSFDYQSIAAAVPSMAEAAGDLVARWKALPAGTVIDMAQEMRRATLRIIASTMFSADSRDIEALVERSVERYQTQLRPSLLDFLGLPEWLPRWRQKHLARATLAEVTVAIDRIIAERRAAPEPARPDLLARLLSARDDGVPLTASEIRAQVLTIFMAGHETTSLALTWAWYLLAQHPAAQAKLEAELASVLGGRPPRHEDVANLAYTRMVMEEALRLYPPAHTISRQALGPDEVCGRRVKKGAIVFVMPWVLHRHRRLWDNPDAFVPERFSPEQSAARPRWAYLPFGDGPRVCIGAAFALTEAIVVLAALAQRFRPALVPGQTIEPHGLITLRPRHGMMMTLEKR
ncbi:MAG TPA: cytochrome P450 [Stellaceae bacterium]|nr:cytochrome P450 [Stellaceae bacterium]